MMSQSRRLVISLSLLVLFMATSNAPALSADAPYLPSTVVKQLSWASASTITRLASGSDGWPLTWAEDNSLYSAYGDGFGFEPNVPKKLSLGFGKISGPADALIGVNIRSATGEAIGDGKGGKKPGSILMVDGMLYLWARNADGSGGQCQLASSNDHAKTWIWSDWKFQSFGYCAFLNFGKNYIGSRDGFVYMYSHDGPSAYIAADTMVLTRVSKDQITNRAAYEFFRGVNDNGDPLWTSDINQREAVFSNPANCLRSGITFNAGIGRYLWWQQIPSGSQGVDTRFSGGFGIYDAPEPWGPWTTVYFTESWDVGPGENASFPTKWMSADGKTLHLVFSGNDSFSVRAATINLYEQSSSIPLPPENLEAN
ncbi:MAG: hypothetical protein V3S33_07175 [Gammaproteobacteria bacterium]